MPEKQNLKHQKKPVNKMRSLSSEGLSTQERNKMIADNAYFRAQRRNFPPEGIESDWLDAEYEVNSWLTLSTQCLKKIN